MILRSGDVEDDSAGLGLTGSSSQAAGPPKRLRSGSWGRVEGLLSGAVTRSMNRRTAHITPAVRFLLRMGDELIIILT